MLADYFKLAFRSLLNRKLRSWLTMLGIFIGIAAVVSLISLGQGMQMAIESQFASLGTNTITIQPAGGGFGPPGTLSASKITEDDLDVVQRVSGVERAFGRLVKPAEAEFNDETEVIFVGSFPPEQDDRDWVIDGRDMSILNGRFLEQSDTFKVIIGNNYYRDPVFGRPLRVGDKIQINGRDVDVVGVLKRTGSPEVNIAFFMNEDPMRELLDIPKEYSLIAARTSSSDNVDQVAESIKRALRNSRDVDEGKEDFNVETAQELLDSFSSILNIVQIVLIGIAGISLFVGGIGITNTMYTAVLERTREIGIMKAIGARNSDVLLIFIFESGLLGMAGGIIGILLGVGLSKGVEYGASAAGIDLLQAHFPLTLLLGALAFSFIVGTISGLMPARRASQMNPVEALRS